MKRKPKPEKPVPVDPEAEVFREGDNIEVRRRPLWTGYIGKVIAVSGGICHCEISHVCCGPQFFADIPARELRKIV